jgi:hypothetical protein
VFDPAVYGAAERTFGGFASILLDEQGRDEEWCDSACLSEGDFRGHITGYMSPKSPGIEIGRPWVILPW